MGGVTPQSGVTRDDPLILDWQDAPDLLVLKATQGRPNVHWRGCQPIITGNDQSDKRV